MPKKFFDPDDLVIKDMEKKLKLKKRKKIPKSFFDQGLGDLLECVDQITNNSKFNSAKKKKITPESPQLSEDEEQQSTRNVESDEEEDEFSGDKKDMDNDQSDSGDDEPLEMEDQVMAALKKRKEAKDKLKKPKQTDLYGFESGSFDKEVMSKVSQDNVQENKDLVRQIRGQLNRLTTSSLPSISSLIETFYMKSSLFQVNETICKIIRDLVVIEPTLSPSSLFREMSLMLATLHENVGDEVGGHAVHYFVKLFHELLHRPDQDDSCKKLDNAVALLCHFYAVGLIHITLFIEIIGEMVHLFNEKSIELLMFTLTAVGFIIRKDSPELMKQLILQVQSKANTVESGTFGKRIEFMLETLTEIKNNNILKVANKASNIINPIERDELRNILKTSLKRSTKVTPLRGSLKQVITSNRWWVKVGTLLEQEQQHDNNNGKYDKGSSKDKSEFNLADQFTLENAREEKICRALRLNTTPFRRSLFKAIITSSDYIEASDRIVAMCRKAQSSEAANVLITIAIHEKELNMFYVHTLKRISNFDRQYKFSIFMALRDRIKDVSNLNAIKRSNLSKLMLHLMKEKVISPAVLKVIDFASITEDSNKMDLMKQTIQSITEQEPDIMKSIFDSIPKKDHVFLASIKYFISCFMDESNVSSKTRELLLAKMKLAHKMKQQQLETFANK